MNRTAAVPASTTPPHRGRRALLVLFGVALGLVVVELGLQAASWIAWKNGQREAVGASGGAADEGRPKILCVGDSYTWGMGASDAAGSYPAQLQRLLREGGADVDVVNGGWPGQTSREVLLRLGAHLRQHRPRLVYVLIGSNDLSQAPQRVPEDAGADSAEAAPGFPLRLRLPRLVRLAAAWLSGARPSPAPPPPFVGTWHAGTHELRIEADGQVRMLDAHPARWYLDGDRLIVQDVTRGAFDTGYRLDGDQLLLRVPGLPQPLRLSAGPATDLPSLERARRAAAAGEHEAAAQLFREALANATGADEVTARSGLAFACASLGRRDEAEAQVTWLRERATHDRAAAAGLLHAMAALGRVEEALQLTSEWRERGIDTLPIWEVLVQVSQDTAQHEALQRSIAAMLADDRVQGTLRVHLMRAHYSSLLKTDPGAALRTLLDAECLYPHPVFTRSRLQEPAFTTELFERTLAAMPIDDEQRSRLRQLFTPDASAFAAVRAVLDDHLRRIVAGCRAAGARPVLLTYPFHERTVAGVIRDVAASTGTDLIAVADEFDHLLQTLPWEELFVADAHCSDRGYGVIARLAAAHARAHL